MKQTWKRILATLLTVVMLAGVAPVASLWQAYAASANETAIYNFLIGEMGLNTAAACGVLANIEKESNFNPKCSYTESGGYQSYGICQWNKGRLDSLKAFCSGHGYDYTSLNGQLHYLNHELSTNSRFKPTYNKLYSVANNADGAYAAGYTWCYNFEVPAGYNTGVSEKRGNVAKQYFSRYQSGSSSSASVDSVFVSVAGDGLENAMFPLDTLHISRTNKFLDPDQNSAPTWGGHGGGFAWDLCGGSRDVHAPFTGKIVYLESGGNHCVILKSTNKVHLANGQTDYLTMLICHDNDISNLKSGQTIKQGQMFYQQGNYGDATGVHAHIELAKGNISYRGTSGDISTMRKSSNRIQLNDALFLTTKTKISKDYIRVEGKKPAYNKYLTWRKIAPITLSATDPTEITNTSAKIYAKLSCMAPLMAESYVISTNESDISGKDYTVNANRVWIRDNNPNGDYVNPHCYEGNLKSVNAISWVVKELNGRPLTPNTTYYYKMLVKDGSGNWYSTQTKSFKTRADKPEGTVLRLDAAYQNIGIGDTAVVSWAAAKYATAYEVQLYNSTGTQIHSSGDLISTTYAFPGSCFVAPGEYYAKLIAKNTVPGGAREAEGQPRILVHPDVSVTFYDTVAEQAIQTYPLAYGHNAVAPQSPVQYGYTFKGWNQSFDKVTGNITVNTVYEANTYTVNFVNGMTGEVLDTQRVKYKESAAAPSKTPTYRNGYDFQGWDKDYTSITGDTTVKSVFKWYDEDYPVSTEIVSANLNVGNAEQSVGYDVVVRIGKDKNEAVQGRLVFALKTEDGFLYTSTESSAFSLAAGENEKTITCFVPSETHAYVIEVYTLNNYENAGPIAMPVSSLVNNNIENAYSPWSEEYPVGQTDVETRTVRETHTEYLYTNRVKSYATSLPGYRRIGYEKGEVVESGQLKYVNNWFKYFDKSSSLYKKYNITPKKASETETTITEINNDQVTSYIYYHWCRGTYNSGPINRKINDENVGEFKQFHAYETTVKKDDTTFESSQSGVCKDTYWWWGGSRRADVHTQTYTVYKKLYIYELITNDNDWTTVTPAERGITDSELYVSKLVSTNKTEYRYRTNELVFAQPSANQRTNLQELGTIDAEKYGGRAATVFIYKYTQASDYTTEAVIPTVIGSDGTVWVENALLREAMSEGGSDYQIVASVKGYTAAVPVGVIEAPKKQFTVKYYDFDHETVILEETVEEGGTVTAPSPEELTLPEGQRFTYWGLSTVGVHANLDVYPNAEAKDCVVVFIDWNSQTYELRELVYGDEIIFPPLESDQFTESYWETEGLTPNPAGEGFVVTGNTVITSNKADREIRAAFLTPEAAEVIGALLPEEEMEGVGVAAVSVMKDMTLLKENGTGIEDAKNDVAAQIQDYVEENTDLTADQIVQLEDALQDGVIVKAKGGDAPIEIPDLNEDEEAPKYLFYGWKQISGTDYLINAATETDEVFIPVYSYAETCDTPSVSVPTGEYDANQTISFTCDTERAQIWYTLDGSDPHVSETTIEYFDANGNPQPFTITQSSVLTYYAGALGMNDSDMITELYAVNKVGGGTEYHILTVHSSAGVMDEENAFLALIREGQYYDIPDAISDVEGFTFDGLFYDETFEDEFFVDEEPVTESLDLYAKHTANTYTVTFLDYDGRVLSTQTVAHGEEAEPPAPTREGYVFTGWNDDGYLSVTESSDYTATYCAEDEYVTLSFKRVSNSGQAGKMIGLGKKLNVMPASLSDTPISWHTSDPSVATVDYEGTVSFLNEGVVTISAVAEISGERAEVTFDVKADDSKQVTLSSNASYGLDALQFIREVPAQTTVGEARKQFLSGELLTFEKENENGITEVLAENALIGTGISVVLYEEDSETKLDSKQIIVTGDFDGDGKITAQDASHVSRYLVEKETAELWQLVAADCNGDGKVNVRDASMIARYTVGKEIW